MEAYSTLSPTNFLLKCVALNCIRKKEDKLISFWSLMKTLLIIFILCSINAIALYFKTIESNFAANGFTLTDVLKYEFLLGFFKYIVDLVYVGKYSSKQSICYYYAYDNIDNILKMSDYNKIKITCLKIIVSTCAMCIFGYILDIIAWYFALPHNASNISFLLDYFYGFAQVLTVLDMVSHVLQIEHRLRALGDIAEKIEKNYKNKSKRATENSSNYFEVSNVDKLKILNVRFTETGSWSPEDISSLSQCYLMLIKQTEFINTMFGFRILLTCIINTIRLTNKLNIIIRIPFEKQNSSFVLIFLSSILCLLTACFNMVTLAHRCEKVYRQSERIVKIVEDMIIYRKARDEIILPLKELRELISSRPIGFHTSHFFRIDYTLLSSMTSVVVTYTVIFLQSLKT